MANHFVRVVDDGTLNTDDGWAIARCEDNGDLYFLVERGAATDEAVLHAAWTAAAQLVIEEAVRDGIVTWVREPVGSSPDPARGRRRVGEP